MTQDGPQSKPGKRPAAKAAGKAAAKQATKAPAAAPVKPDAAPQRRGGGFRLASDKARPVFDKVAGRHGFAQADVLLRWAEIAGEALAPTCRPVKVRYGGNRQLGATLVVAAEGARAPEVEHQTARIIERVNQFYGYRAISRVQIVQTGPEGFAEPASVFAGPDLAPSPAESARAADLTCEVQDEGLRAALTRLGANVLARGRAGAIVK